ncbi:hypothetical protein Pelo_5703 [Pelomyxa schiedti]|nr:hypothetical protein Pelo_5703 [Pelomyxa schiedti]
MNSSGVTEAIAAIGALKAAAPVPRRWGMYHGVLVGSRAAALRAPKLRPPDKSADWDVIMWPSDLVEALSRGNTSTGKSNALKCVSCTVRSPVRVINSNTTTGVGNGSPTTVFVGAAVALFVDNFKFDIEVPDSGDCSAALILEAVASGSKTADQAFLPFVGIVLVPHISILAAIKRSHLHLGIDWKKHFADYCSLLSYQNQTTFGEKEMEIIARRSLEHNAIHHIDLSARTDHLCLTESDFRHMEDDTSRIKAICRLLNKNAEEVLEEICTSGPMWLSGFILQNTTALVSEILSVSNNEIAASTEAQPLFESFPHFINELILRQLNSVDLRQCSCVCARWHNILSASNISLWQNLCAYHGWNDLLSSQFEFTSPCQHKLLYFSAWDTILALRKQPAAPISPMHWKTDQLALLTYTIRARGAKSVYTNLSILREKLLNSVTVVNVTDQKTGNPHKFQATMKSAYGMFFMNIKQGVKHNSRGDEWPAKEVALKQLASSKKKQCFFWNADTMPNHNESKPWSDEDSMLFSRLPVSLVTGLTLVLMPPVYSSEVRQFALHNLSPRQYLIHYKLY